MDEKEAIGRKVQYYRKMKRLSQESLAELLEVTPICISKIEHGKRYPSVPLLIKMANVLEITADMLLVDTLNETYKMESSTLSELLDNETPEKRRQVFSVVHAMLDN